MGGLAMRRVVARAVLPALVASLLAAGCGAANSTPRGPDGSTGSRVVVAAASINAWGSILGQLGGTHVHETSIITNPDTDPHDYEPTPADGRLIATARLFVENGIGYDTWAAKALAASPDAHRSVVDVGDVVGVGSGGNPHRWYSPGDVEKVADAITAGLSRVDPPDAAYFAAQRQRFETLGLARYHQLIGDIGVTYAGIPVGASESIFAPLSDALGLDLLTPPSFLRAISQGSEPSAADKATIDAQITDKKIDVYVFNRQNSTPDVSAQVTAARARGIPVVAITETLSPASASFQDWQVAQLQALAAALHRATGR
jgi:zinc/manganese transport system substrate-binding protein